jgi:hypothetical protein
MIFITKKGREINVTNKFTIETLKKMKSLRVKEPEVTKTVVEEIPEPVELAEENSETIVETTEIKLAKPKVFTQKRGRKK